LVDENIITNEVQSELTGIDDLSSNDLQYQFNLNNEFSVDENEYEVQKKETYDGKKLVSMMTNTDMNEGENYNMEVIDHHDSDTESFYNIWGDDEEWLHDNKLRNAVRNIHR